MSNYSKLILIALLSCFSLFPFNVNAATINAASCSQADVTDAYNKASAGDKIVVPAGDSTWTSTLSISKNNITLQGAGIDRTYLRHGTFGGPLVRIEANGVRITGFTFDGDYLLTQSGICVGKHVPDPTHIYSNFRIDNCKFIDYTRAQTFGGATIEAYGFVYGVIDHNIFNDCTGECILICADGVKSLERSLEFGQYTNGTIYIEDNTWNYNQTGFNAMNAVDGNSGGRWVIRYNTFNVGQSSRVNAIISNHETCSNCSGSAVKSGDCGGLTMEIYENKVNNYALPPLGPSMFVMQRGGRALIYNNNIYINDTPCNYIVSLRNYRSFAYPCPDDQWCAGSTHTRGYSRWCHDADFELANLITEGREFGKTTLAEDLDNSETSIDIASVADFPTDGGSIMIGKEQIDYTGIQGTTLTGCTRGANWTTSTTHNTGADIDLFIFGQCLEQINNTYIWGNKTVGGKEKNGASVYAEWYLKSACNREEHNDYSSYDIKSSTERPKNWQYRNDGTVYSYTPFPYPHPLTKQLAGLPAPEKLHITDVEP